MNPVIIITGASRGIGAATAILEQIQVLGAIDTLTIGLSREVAGEGIGVNAIRPTFIYTNMHANGGEADRVDRIKSTIPMLRGGTPLEVAQAIM